MHKLLNTSMVNTNFSKQSFRKSSHNSFKGTVIQTEEALINDCLRVSKIP